jgi:hypothetical protein
MNFHSRCARNQGAQQFFCGLRTLPLDAAKSVGIRVLDQGLNDD